MRIEEHTLGRAFDAFHDRHVVNASRAWDLDHHARLWLLAQRAFDKHDFDVFAEIYDELRRHWQIARGKNAKMATPKEVFHLLCELPASLRQTRLSSLTDNDTERLVCTVETMACVKQSKNGPSIMAVSKILHFLNPRLFIIVDRGMVWDWALNHMWLWRPIDKLREPLRAKFPHACGSGDASCDPISYVAILLWAGQMLRENPEVPRAFARYLRSKCDGKNLPADLETYEAVAMEWLMLGLVELPPAGVA